MVTYQIHPIIYSIDHAETPRHFLWPTQDTLGKKSTDIFTQPSLQKIIKQNYTYNAIFWDFDCEKLTPELLLVTFGMVNDANFWD